MSTPLHPFFYMPGVVLLPVVSSPFFSHRFYANWDGSYMKMLYLKTFRAPGRKKKTFGKLNISVKSMINLLLFRKVRN